MAEGLSDAEKAAVRQRAAEVRTEKRRGKKKDTEPEVLAKIAGMPEPDRSLASAIHAIVRETAPDLQAKLWYGFPAYARDGKVVCFVQPASKFGVRYLTLGFQEAATLDDGNMWATSYAVVELGDAEKARITHLVRDAVR